MKINDIISNHVEQNGNSVWVLKSHKDFGYSDGRESEKYLESVFSKVSDLSSRSEELELYIKDWASEYHLSVKRSQLLSGFDYDSSKKVLEVGCGCGAITRFLGETFEHVVSIEGNVHRANLARLRTRDLNGISIICAPFQEIEFKEKFDIVFCIGVYEYSSSFVNGDDPYEEVLNYFDELLTPNGIVVIAIENQFGMKYFSSSSEDHVGLMFEGVEGYHRIIDKVKTFGKNEIREKLQPHYNDIKFYFPYSDYKLADGVLSEEFLNSGKAGELVSQFKSRDYRGQRKSLFDEALATFELEKNSKLPFFANSFLIVAAKKEITGVSFDQLGVLYSPNRRSIYSTKSIIRKNGDEIIIEKNMLSDNNAIDKDIKLVGCTSIWSEGLSVQTQVYMNSKSKSKSIEEIFSPCIPAINFLKDNSTIKNDIRYLEGKYVDATWANLYCDKEKCDFIDQEWIYNNDIKFNLLIIRSIYRFLINHYDLKNSSPHLQGSHTKNLIKKVAHTFDVTLSEDDFREFVSFEALLYSKIYKSDYKTNKTFISLYLKNSKVYKSLKTIKKFGNKVKKLARRFRDKTLGNYVN